MAGKDIIMLSREERKRGHVLHKVLDGELKQVEAAEILSLSFRHANRLVHRVRREGDKAIAHKSRGKPSNRRLPEEQKEKALNLYRERYKGFGPTLFTEKLLLNHKTRISDETVRKWLIESGDIKRARKGRVHRKWRERKHHFGEMVQNLSLKVLIRDGRQSSQLV